MSTKNLARTVIEGGRAHANTEERRESHRGERAKLRSQLEWAKRDLEAAEDVVFVRRKHVRRCFHDKLAPADRWMRKQVGRPWRQVESELLKLFDTSTLAGRHIVFDHMMRRDSWDADGGWTIKRTYFRVDSRGMLRSGTPRRRVPWKSHVRAVRPSELARALAWAGVRKVLSRGAARYWCEPTLLDATLDLQRYRQARRLDEDESAFFDSLSEACREALAWEPTTPRDCG